MLVRTAMLVGNLPLPSLSGVAFSGVFVPNDGGGEFAIVYGVTNAAGGEYVTVAWTVTGTHPGGTTSGPYTSSPTSPAISTPLYTGDTINATVRLYSATATLLDTVTLSPYNC
jgi:hypothetical protein